MPYGGRKLEPIGEPLQAGCLAGGDDAVLIGMDGADGLKATAVRPCTGAKGWAEAVGVKAVRFGDLVARTGRTLAYRLLTFREWVVRRKPETPASGTERVKGGWVTDSLGYVVL